MKLSFLLTKPDIPFDREDANRYLPLVIALMVCLSALFLVAALSIQQAAKHINQTTAEGLQVYVPYQAQGQDAKVTKIRDALVLLDSVNTAERLSVDQVSALVEPWIGEDMALETLPLPAVLDVQLSEEAEAEAALANIRTILNEIDPEITVETYQQWLDQLAHFASVFQWVSVLLAMFLFAALAAVIAIVVRTSLKLHFKIVQLLHMVGAQDRYIVEQFIINAVWLMFKGALIGTSGAILITVILSAASANLASPLLPPFEILFSHVMMFILLPFLVAAIAYFSVHRSITVMLSRMH